MPTVILLDVSLSMCRSLSKRTINGNSDNEKDKTNSVEIRQLANVGIGVLLDYFAQNAQLEYTALVVFSSLWEVRHDFTRNHESIKNGIYELDLYDKSNIVNAVRGILSLKLDEWAQEGTINIILVTDGQYYARKNTSASPETTENEFDDVLPAELKDHFDIPCKMQVVCLASPRDPSLKQSLKFYSRLISTADDKTTDCPILSATNMKQFKQSAIWLPESNTREVSIESVENLFEALAEAHYKPFHTVVTFGHLSSMVLLSPKPAECLVETLKNEFDDIKNEEKHNSAETFVSALDRARLFKLDDEINICGFLPMTDIASPAVISRHLVLPVPSARFNEIHKAQQILSQDPKAYKSTQTGGSTEGVSGNGVSKRKKSELLGDINKVNNNSTVNGVVDSIQDLDTTKQPSFCVLLHNCLKQESMVAICLIGKNDETNEDWFAILHPHVDSKKKSGMLLSLLMPGSQPIPWLPSFRSIGSTCLNSDCTPTILDKPTNSRSSSKSYSSNNVIWLDPESVQADVQKVVRYARRGVDKAPQFYKELNRIRRAALSYGFFDVLTGLANILEKERRSMISDTSRPTNQAMLHHIDHVISSLRTKLSEDSYDVNILPIT